MLIVGQSLSPEEVDFWGYPWRLIWRTREGQSSYCLAARHDAKALGGM
jgi:hypothetical protein